jgi:hypothetical protein
VTQVEVINSIKIKCDWFGMNFLRPDTVIIENINTKEYATLITIPARSVSDFITRGQTPSVARKTGCC